MKYEIMNLHETEFLSFNQMPLEDMPESLCLEAKLWFNEA